MTQIQLHGPLHVGAMAPIPGTVLERLRELLSSGVEAIPDKHRPNFYTVHDQDRSVYFYISPVSAKVWVLESHIAKSRPETIHAMAQPA